MFFKKSREAKQQAAEQARVEAVKCVQQQLDAALALPDKAERLLKTAEISDAIDTLTQDTTRDVGRASRNKMYAPYLAVTGSAAGTAAVVVLGLHFPPVLMLLVFPSIFGGLWAGSARVGRAQKSMLEENKTLFDGLAGIKAQAGQAMDAMMRDNLQELAASPKISEALARVPQLREHFSQAFVLKTTAAPEVAPEPPKPSGKNGLSL